MKKRSQAAVYMLAGVILLISVLLIFLLTEFNKFPPKDNTIKLMPIDIFIDSCLKISSDEAVSYVFERGGYFHFPEDTVLINNKVPVFFKSGITTIPNPNVIKDSLILAVLQNMEKCLNKYKDFKDIKVTGKDSVQVEMQDTIKFYYKPGNIKGIESNTENVYYHAINLNFQNLFEAISLYGKEYDLFPDLLLVGTLTKLSNQKVIDIDFIQEGVSGEKVIIDFKQNDINFRFGQLFEWAPEYVKPIESDFVSFDFIEIAPWNIDTPGDQSLFIKTSLPAVNFQTDSDDISIDTLTGEIKINADDFDNEQYLYYIKATDEFNNSIIRSLHININVNDGSKPIINPIEKQTAYVGKLYRYNVTVSNPQDYLIYKSQSQLFDIDEIGRIEFIPKKEDIGAHTARVDVSNNNGGTWLRWDIEVI